MSEDIEDVVIETGVDSLLNYLAEHGKASTSEISDRIGVDEDRVKQWGEALSDEGLVDKHYTLTSGLVLEYTQKNLEEASRKKAEIEEELQETSEEVEGELEDKRDRIRENRNRLDEGLDEEEKDEIVRETISELESIEKRIDRRLEEDKLDHQTIQLIAEIEDVLKKVQKLIENHLDESQNERLEGKTEEAVSEVEKALEKAEEKEGKRKEQQEIQKKLKAVKKLEQNIETARKNADSHSNGGLISKLISLLPVSKKNQSTQASLNEPVDKEIRESNKIKKHEVPEKTYQELVDENRVTEVMRKISLIEDPDYESILKAEKQNRNREELTSYLEERVS